jgi:hypothetical protein
MSKLCSIASCDVKALMAEGVGFAAIYSNEAKGYPEDSFEL